MQGQDNLNTEDVVQERGEVSGDPGTDEDDTEEEEIDDSTYETEEEPTTETESEDDEDFDKSQRKRLVSSFVKGFGVQSVSSLKPRLITNDNYSTLCI